MNTMKFLTLTLALVLTALAPIGCQTYVNIPPQEADTANHNPNGKVVRKVMVLAIRAALDDGGITEPVQVMLPTDTNLLSHKQIVSALGERATLPFEGDTASSHGVVSVQGVRLRAARGEVDIARPVGDGIDQLVTVYLSWKPLGGWQVDRVHAWRGVPVNEQSAPTSQSQE
jgi:hypothetical protein